METAVQFWIGDWLNYGQQRAYGEKYSELVGETIYTTTAEFKNASGPHEPRCRG